MSVPTWPAAPFPQVMQQAGYKESTSPTFIRTNMDAGVPIMRNRYTAAIRSIKGDIRCTVNTTVDDIDTIDNFYFGACGGGPISFLWTTQRPTGIPPVVVPATCRWVSPPEYSNDGGVTWTVSLDLEIIPTVSVISGGGVVTTLQDSGTAAPTTGTWVAGWIRWNSAPAPGGNVGWICTTGGTPGSWWAFGSISE